MEFLQQITLFGLLLASICVFLAAVGKMVKQQHRRPPEPAGTWPLIGHLHLLGADKLLHQTLGAMADRYGPVFSIRLGTRQALVVSGWEVAKECFTTNDKIFPERPKLRAVKIMGYDFAMMGFAPYGQYWRDVRKLAMSELLAQRGLEILKYVQNEELTLLVKKLYQIWVRNGGESPILVEMKQVFGDLAMNIIVRMLAGKRSYSAGACGDEESRRCQRALGDFMHLVGLNMISDAIPILGWIDVLRGYVGEMKRTARDVDSVLGNWVKEHRQKKLAMGASFTMGDFIDVMLSLMDENRLCGRDADTVIKATLLSLLLGGNDTTVVTLTWALSLLLNHRSALKKAQDELDNQVGKHRQVNESDINNLTYLQAIIKETLRLYPATPISPPREALEDCFISGFHVPAGTRLLVNLWKLLRDPRIWSDPLEFRPERFLTENAGLTYQGHDFEFIPFGSGRRACPGIKFADQVLHLTLAKLLQGFEFATVADFPVDMTESPGLTNPKATPLEVLLTPRLHPTLYEDQI